MLAAFERWIQAHANLWGILSVPVAGLVLIAPGLLVAGGAALLKLV